MYVYTYIYVYIYIYIYHIYIFRQTVTVTVSASDRDLDRVHYMLCGSSRYSTSILRLCVSSESVSFLSPVTGKTRSQGDSFRVCFWWARANVCVTWLDDKIFVTFPRRWTGFKAGHPGQHISESHRASDSRANLKSPSGVSITTDRCLIHIRDAAHSDSFGD